MYQNKNFIFSAGAADMNQVIGDTALDIDEGDPDTPLARFTLTGHAYKAGSEMVIAGVSADYNGMARIHAVDTNTFDVLVKPRTPAAATPDGANSLIFPGIVYPKDRYFLIGFELHLASAGAAAEDLEVSVDSIKGAYWDVKIYDDSMLGVQDIIYYPEIPLILEAGDIVKFAWANAGNITWGLKIITEKCNV